MPRPPESPFRRFMMQAIMWIILGGTIGLAALVDRQKARKADAPLGDITTLENGISLRLPKGWSYDTENSDSLVLAQDPHYPRIVDVRVNALSWSALWNTATGRRSILIGAIPFGDGVGELRSHVGKTTDDDIFLEFAATAPLARGRTMNIALRIYGPLDPADLEKEKDLIKRIAASVKLPADMQIAPATQPQPEAVQ